MSYKADEKQATVTSKLSFPAQQPDVNRGTSQSFKPFTMPQYMGSKTSKAQMRLTNTSLKPETRQGNLNLNDPMTGTAHSSLFKQPKNEEGIEVVEEESVRPTHHVRDHPINNSFDDIDFDMGNFNFNPN